MLLKVLVLTHMATVLAAPTKPEETSLKAQALTLPALADKSSSTTDTFAKGEKHLNGSTLKTATIETHHTALFTEHLQKRMAVLQELNPDATTDACATCVEAEQKIVDKLKDKDEKDQDLVQSVLAEAEMANKLVVCTKEVAGLTEERDAASKNLDFNTCKELANTNIETVSAVGGVFDDTVQLAHAQDGFDAVVNCVEALKIGLQVVADANEAVQVKKAECGTITEEMELLTTEVEGKQKLIALMDEEVENLEAQAKIACDNMRKQGFDNTPFTPCTADNDGVLVCDDCCKTCVDTDGLLTLGPEVKTIPSPDFASDTMVFNGCSGIKTINMAGVETIGDYAFQACFQLESVDMATVKTIKHQAFASCKRLKTANMAAVTTIEVQAFSQCKLLETADMPVVQTIGNQAFLNDCELKLKSVKIDEANFYQCEGTFTIGSGSTCPEHCCPGINECPPGCLPDC